MIRKLGWTFALALASLVLSPWTLSAADWSHWRGPMQTGFSPDKNLPGKVDGNVIWRQPYGSRSTPLVFNDRLYLFNYDSDKVKAGGKLEDVAETIQERVMCLDAKSGQKIWQKTFPVFHTDIVTSRLGWTNLAADPVTGYIYAHGTQGLFICFDGKDGTVKWQHSMGEEYGRVSGYGGRVTTPIVDEDLAILGMVNSSWGPQAKGANRFVAFDKRTGKVVWWSEPAGVKGTYYSAPVIATINGQRLLISGGSDGSVFGIKVRTGEPVWHYIFSVSAINSTPVVDGNLVYIGHGEESPGTNVQGRVICVDASQVTDGKPKLVWQVDGIKARYASPIINEGRLYMPDDGGRLFCLDAKDGKQYWKFNFGRGEVRGSPVMGDGKIYIGEVSARFHILEPGPKKCKRLDEEFFPGAGGVDIELNGTPAIANGRVYFTTAEEILCIGLPNGISTVVPPSGATAIKPGKIAHLQIVPAEVALHPGASVTFKARAFDADGNFIKEVKADWSLPAPAPPPGVKANPPALKGKISVDGMLTVDPTPPNQGSIVVAKAEGIVGKARVRVVPNLPYAIDFEKVPDGGVPAGWINTQGKWVVKTVDGNKVLAKVNNKFSPLFSRGHAYITLPDSKDYTIESDLSGTELVRKNDSGEIIRDRPEFGVGANRYVLILDAKLEKLRLMSWDALPRIDKTVNFPWKPGVWYRFKLTTDMGGGKGIIRGKAWPRDQKEPADWTVEVNDSRPIGEGSASVYGYVTGNFNDKPGTEIYCDNVRITPNKGAAAPKAPRVGAAPLAAQPEGTFVYRQSPRRPLLALLWRLRR